MKAPPSFQPARRRKARIMTRDDPQSWTVEFFRSPVRAFLFTFALAFGAIVIYTSLHFARKAPHMEAEAFLRVADNGHFRLDFQLASLRRFYAAANITALQEQLEGQRKEQSALILHRRRAVLGPLIEVVQTRVWTSEPPPVFGSRATDADLLGVGLSDTLLWLTNNAPRFPTEHEPLIRNATYQLMELHKAEEDVRKALKGQLASLDPILPFSWLYTDSPWWLIEVMMWSFLGVLANTVIGLIMACRERRYAPEEYLLILPKLFLAPGLAFIVITFWATGISESTISHLNLPYFLVISFLLGFVTEGIYDRLRQLGDILIPTIATADRAKMEALGGKPYQPMNPSPAEDAPAPRNLTELEAHMKAVAKAAMERGIITRLASKSD